MALSTRHACVGLALFNAVGDTRDLAKEVVPRVRPGVTQDRWYTGFYPPCSLRQSGSLGSIAMYLSTACSKWRTRISW
jgi:hypothetical protein